MESDHHCREETPAHGARVNGFWMDRTPVTNNQFRKFVNATGYVTFAEIAPDPKDYPAHMLRARSLIFAPQSMRSISVIGRNGGPLILQPTGGDHIGPAHPSAVSASTRSCKRRQ